MKNFTKLVVLLLLITFASFQLTSCARDIPTNTELDNSTYITTFFDDFNGDKLNTEYWKINDMPNENPTLNGYRRGGIYSKDMVSVSNGSLHIKTKYINNSWYTG